MYQMDIALFYRFMQSETGRCANSAHFNVQFSHTICTCARESHAPALTLRSTISTMSARHQTRGHMRLVDILEPEIRSMKLHMAGMEVDDPARSLSVWPRPGAHPS